MYEAIESILAKQGWKINTSFVERLNLDFRQHVAAIGRRVNTRCKHEAGFFHVNHNFVMPHASLRLPLPKLETVPETGVVKKWQAQTPEMAARLSDYVWSLREILMYGVPPWLQVRA